MLETQSSGARLNRNTRGAHPEAALAAEVVALGVWLSQPSIVWALVAFAVGVLAAILTARAGQKFLVAASLLGLLGATTAGVTSGRVRTVERHWDDVREQLISGISRSLAATLESTVRLARSLADLGATAANVSQAAAFERLAAGTRTGGPETGVVVLDSAGMPWSWAGVHRLLPRLPERELNARITPFYVVLESRRQTGNRVAIGHVLIAADSAVPDRERTVASRFARSTGAILEFYAPGRAPFRSDVFDYCLPSCIPAAGNLHPDTLFSIRTVPPTQGALKLALQEGGGRTVSVVAILCLLMLMMAGTVSGRYVALGLVAALPILTPAGALLGLGSFFSPATYYVEVLDPLTASAGALWVTAVIALAGVVAARARKPPARIGLVGGLVVLLLIPLVARTLSNGIAPPPGGVGLNLWLGWEVPIALSVAALVLLAAALLPQFLRPRGWIPSVATVWSIGAALLGLLVWKAGGGPWPGWYVWLWLPPIILVSQSGSRFRQVIAGGLVAGTAAAILTWGAILDGRLRLASADAQRLGTDRDPLQIALLERMGNELDLEPLARTASELYALWQRSPLAEAGYPAALAVWSQGGDLLAELPLARLDLPIRLMQALANSAAARDTAVLEVYDRVPGPHAVLAQALRDGTVLTVGVGPKTRLIPPFRIARLVRPELPVPVPYEMSLSEVTPETPFQEGLVWRREGQTVHGDERLEFRGTAGARNLHVTLDLGEVPALLVRGALLLFADATVVLGFWLLGEALLGRTEFLQRIRQLIRFRTYRFRIAVALAVFFIVPTVGFSAWMAGRLRADSARGEDLVILQTLRDASAALPDDRSPGGPGGEALSAVAERVSAELLLYRSGLLGSVSAPVLAELGLVDALLPPPIYHELLTDEGGEVLQQVSIAGRPARIGFHALGSGVREVLAMPRLPDERPPMSQGDLAYALLLVTLIGLGAAAGLARTAARTLAEPVGALRAAAETVGRGGTPPPFGKEVPEEFVPVADAFTRMAADVKASQAALEAARRRTVAVLRNVATGVVALNRSLQVTLANPRAEEILGITLNPETSVTSASADWARVWNWVAEFLNSDADLSREEFAVAGRRIRVQASALGSESGCVVALDDVTELAHAVRVLAWGEIARQVAHEIKNPLTPMRLGIQHLQRARTEPRQEFDRILDRTSQQILSEIDRLDAVARAFARFGAPPAPQDAGPLAPVDLVAVARETAALYALGGGGGVELATDGVVRGVARPDELREVLVNLVENARNAAATRIQVSIGEGDASTVLLTVSDNGKGIRPEHLPLIFEPHFSTTTSGTGLGLAICKRLVESWGGNIRVESTVDRGTTVTLEIRAGEDRDKRL